MQTAFQTYITRLNSAVSADDFGDTMGDMIAAYGLSRFAYLGISEHGRPPAYVTTYPETWTRHYLSHNYQGIDRVVADVRDNLLPFHWDAANPGRDTSVAQRRIFGEATEFGIVSGFTVPIHDSRGRIAAVTFASERPSSVLQRVINERPHFLHLAAIYFHAHASQRLWQTAKVKRPHLSPREISCLQWTAQGKTAWEIGEILGVSRRTITFHIENAKRKLDAANVAQAIAHALMHGLIDP